MYLHWLRGFPFWVFPGLLLTVGTLLLGLFVWATMGHPFGGWLIFPWICGFTFCMIHPEQLRR
jgi:hypothetical protein